MQHADDRCFRRGNFKFGNMGVGSLRAQGRCGGLKLYCCVPRRALPIHLFGHFL